ncbi:MAG: hypothetical protein JWM68_861 [Verrucomicrobiales bacterium]|nr:hypothetical protein [Verrucomicrobiales bacterium]
MKKAIVGAIVLLVAATALLFFWRPKEQPAASVVFLGYSSDTNGLKVAQIAFTNCFDRPVHYFCRTFNDPGSIDYSLNYRNGSLITNTLAGSRSSGRLMPNGQFVFLVPVPTNGSTALKLSVPYFPENSPLGSLIREIRKVMKRDTGIIALNATVDLP